MTLTGPQLERSTVGPVLSERVYLEGGPSGGQVIEVATEWKGFAVSAQDGDQYQRTDRTNADGLPIFEHVAPA